MKLFFERIYYYWRLSMYGHVHQLCSGFLKENGMDPLFLIWDALASGAEGKTSAGIKTLQRITNRVANGLPLAVAELCIHQMAKMQDFASIEQLEQNIGELQKSANATSVVQAAQILWLTGHSNEALNFVNSLTTQSPTNKIAAALVGWIKLFSADRNSGRWFDMASVDSSISNKPTDPFVMYGKAMYFANNSRWQDALQIFVQLSSDNDFPEASLERARIYIAMNNWDLALEAASEAMGNCPSDCDIHLMNVLNALTQAGDLDSARKYVNNLCECIDQIENENPIYVSRIMNLITSLSWHDPEIVSRCLLTFEPISRNNKDDQNVQITNGYLLLYSNKANEAKDCFQNALVDTSDSLIALTGLISSQISLNDFNEAQNQLDFLEAIIGGQNSLELCTLKAQFSRKQNLQFDITSLISSMNQHIDNVQQIFQSSTSRASGETCEKPIIDRFIDNYLSLDLNIFSSALNEAMNECNTLDKTVSNPQNGILCDIIQRCIDIIPGAIPFSYFLAILAFGEGRYSQATKTIQKVLISHWGYNASHCHLLLAQIRLQMKQYDDAEEELNRAVSFDFGIRSSLRYNMINARLFEARGQYEKSVEILKDLIKSSEYQKSSQNEKVDISIFLARCYSKLNRYTDSINIITEALSLYKNTPDEDRIKLFQGSLLTNMGKISEGLNILETFDPKSSQYSKAHKTAAKIYLTKLNDKTSYIKCLKKMAETVPNKTNYLLLGEALMKVKRFNEVVKYFKSALSFEPNDPNVALQYARSLMIIHNYDSALNAYQHAIEVSHNDFHAQLEYCKALFKLHRYEESRNVITDSMDEINLETNDWESQSIYADFYELLSNIDEKNQDYEQCIDELSDAISIYDKLTSNNRIDIPMDSLLQIKNKASIAYQRFAEIQAINNDKVKAIEALEKALEFNPGSPKILLKLGQLHLENNDKESCQNVCQKLLNSNPDCEEAALMLADISSSDMNDDLKEIFLKKPTFYRTLVRVIEKSAQSGELNSIEELFEKCVETESAGYNFCQGLYNIYKGAPQTALNYLNLCRSDPEWNTQALTLIFLIYVNPNRKYVWCEKKPLATSKDLEAAKKVLSRIDLNDIRQYNALILLSQNTDESVNEALKIYNECDDNDLNIIIGRCKCFIRLDRQKEATRNLNGIIHGKPNNSNINVFVEAFLIMTHISIKENQYDEAIKYVERAIELNQSCGKAWEMRANLFEMKKEYLEAADSYKHAWELSCKTDLGVGFKLAFNYMKGEDPVEAIKVAREILAQHPNYPKLKETIFLPCVAALRP
ncbi:TPR Domain containing protein [Histomonas meleagridis]|uniref:TPR Domain containing protein n=1 Tax=Histomonas meleagridis TaxID=135588 RepID=UPI0035594EEC|nr:TPR Domain containing protein [Histomonas meleagridis]KAH0804373.1 TPR Domain containing protein [Histomonas meleagridis]